MTPQTIKQLRQAHRRISMNHMDSTVVFVQNEKSGDYHTFYEDAQVVHSELELPGDWTEGIALNAENVSKVIKVLVGKGRTVAISEPRVDKINTV